MLLYAIYPRDSDSESLPLLMKIDNYNSAVIAFRSEHAARGFISERLTSGPYSVEELSLKELDKAKKAFESDVSGGSLLVQVIE